MTFESSQELRAANITSGRFDINTTVGVTAINERHAAHPFGQAGSLVLDLRMVESMDDVASDTIDGIHPHPIAMTPSFIEASMSPTVSVTFNSARGVAQ